MYANGKGVKQDYEKAMKWYKKSAENGNSLAELNLAYLELHKNLEYCSKSVPELIGTLENLRELGEKL